MRKAAVVGAGVGVVATGLVGALALLGFPVPIAEYLLFPGGLAAWVYKGDNYRSGDEFLRHMIVFGILLNGLAGAVFGPLVALARRKWVRLHSKTYGR
jgi:hypothetical protein